MSTESDVSRLLSQLTKLTAKGELDWSITDPPELAVRGTDHIYPLYFETRFRNQRIGLAERRFLEYDPDRDRHVWDERVVLMFIDPYGRVVWETSQPASALYNLHRTVREQAADVGGILKNLLSDDPSSEA